MGISSNAHTNGGEIEIREGFSWDEDESVTQRRRQREKASRIFVSTGIVSAIALVVILFEARVIAFGPVATAGPVVTTSNP